MINVIFYFEDNLFTLTMFWTTSIYLGSFLDNMDIILFLDMVILYFVDIKIFDHKYGNGVTRRIFESNDWGFIFHV
jgi:hypothetical protein